MNVEGKKILLIKIGGTPSLYAIIFIFLACIKFTSAQSIQFDYTYGYADYSYGKSIVQLADSSYVFLANTGAPSGNARLLLVRIDKYGFPLYHKEFTDYALYNGNFILRSKDDDLLITGEIKNDENAYHPFIMRVDTLFNQQWCLPVPTQDWAFGKQLAELPNGNIVMIGETYDTDSTDLDGLWVKVSQDGTLLSSHTTQFAGNDGFTSISLWNDSILLVAGYQQDLATTDTVPFYAFFNFEGENILQHVYGNLKNKGVARQAVKDANGNIVNVGFTRQYDANGYKDVYMLVFNELGEKVWDSYVDYEIWANNDNEYISVAIGNNGDVVAGANATGNNYHKPTILLHCYQQAEYDFKVSTVRGGNVYSKADYLSQVIPTLDGGYILIGSTTSIGSHLSNILVCKIDSNLSPMTQPAHLLPIKEYALLHSSTLYPNPTHGVTTLYAQQKTDENVTVTLYNIHSELLWRTSHNFFSNPAFEVNLTSFPPGIYLLHVKNNHFQRIFKISKI